MRRVNGREKVHVRFASLSPSMMRLLAPEISTFYMSSRIKMIRFNRICNFSIAGGVFNYFFGHGFSFIYNLDFCKSESTARDQEPFSR